MARSSSPRDWRAVNQRAAKFNTPQPGKIRPSSGLAAGETGRVKIGDPFLLGPVITGSDLITGYPWNAFFGVGSVADGVLSVNSPGGIEDQRVRSLKNGSTYVVEFAAPVQGDTLSVGLSGAPGLTDMEVGSRAVEIFTPGPITSPVGILSFLALGSTTTVDASAAQGERLVVREVEPSANVVAQDFETLGNGIAGFAAFQGSVDPVGIGVAFFALTGGFSFKNISINRGLRVTNATLTVEHDNAQVGLPVTFIKGDIRPSAPAFAEANYYPQVLPSQPGNVAIRSIAQVDIETLGLPATGPGVVWNIDVTDLVNEILDQSTWEYGDRINLVWDIDLNVGSGDRSYGIERNSTLSITL